MAWCKANGWNFITDSNIQGTEDECIVILTRPKYLIYPEYFSRARNVLVIVTTCENFIPEDGIKNQKIPFSTFRYRLQSAVDHCSIVYKCPTTLSEKSLAKKDFKVCKYLGKQILKKIVIARAQKKCDGCGIFPIIGGVKRYKCIECEDFDLCENCILTDNIHPEHHEMKLTSTLKEMSDQEFNSITYSWHLWNQNLHLVKQIESNYLGSVMPMAKEIIDDKQSFTLKDILSTNTYS